MTFLTNQPDLSGTIYEQQSLHEPREYLVSEIRKVNPGWFDEPQGPLGDYWKRDDTYATCYLLWIAWMMSSISNNITQRSVTRLQEKLKALLYPPSPEKFTENLTELEVAWAFVGRVSPVAFDPLVSEEAFASPNRPSTPDFAFQLPTDQHAKELVYVEVTVWHVGILDKWDNAVNQITTTIQNRLFKQGRTLKLQVQLPLQEYDGKQITQMTNRAWSQIRLSDAGRLTLVDKGTIQWSPYPVTAQQENASSLSRNNGSVTPASQRTAFGFGDVLLRMKVLDDAPGFINITSSGIFHSSNILADRAFARVPDIAILSEKDMQMANELIVQSFCQKLKRKRVQFPHNEPYLLVIKPGHFRLLSNGLADMIEQQIWSNQDYSWVTGIVLFTSRRGFLPSDPGPQVLVFLHPHARCQASDALNSVIDGSAQFHFD